MTEMDVSVLMVTQVKVVSLMLTSAYRSRVLRRIHILSSYFSSMVSSSFVVAKSCLTIGLEDRRVNGYRAIELSQPRGRSVARWRIRKWRLDRGNVEGWKCGVIQAEVRRIQR
jgi:hypothetical protein